MADEATDAQLSFNIKTSGDGKHTVTMSESATVLDLKSKLATKEYEDIPVERQRLIYSGRVMKNEDALSKYAIKAGNTVHMVKSAASNAIQNPASSSSTGPAAAVPVNMAAGTNQNDPLAALTGARYAGHAQLPGMDMFGADGGMGAPMDENAMAEMLENPAVAQQMNEFLNNDAAIDMMINSNPQLRAMGPAAREMFRNPLFRQSLTNPDVMRQAARMRRQMQGGQTGGFPMPGATDTTPAGQAGLTTAPGAANPQNPFGSLFGMGAGAPGAANPFAALMNNGGFPFAAQGNTPAASPPVASAGATPAGARTPADGARAGTQQAANPFASLFQPEQMQQIMNNMTPEQLQQSMAMMQQMGLGGANAGGMGGLFGAFGDAPSTGAAAAPTDNRPPEELYADQLRQLNDMGFFDFDANVQALRRSGGSVTGAVNSLLGA